MSQKTKKKEKLNSKFKGLDKLTDGQGYFGPSFNSVPPPIHTLTVAFSTLPDHSRSPSLLRDQ